MEAYPLNMILKSSSDRRCASDVFTRDLGEVHDYRPRVEGQVISETGEKVLFQV
jgi:hypothetical protein